jgi:hypothetical protein
MNFLEYIKNKQVKTAGIVKGIVKHNLKKNKLGLGIGFASGYLPNKKVGEGINSMLNTGVHIVPGITPEGFDKEMKKKPISSRIGNRSQISEELRNIKKQ